MPPTSPGSIHGANSSPPKAHCLQVSHKTLLQSKNAAFTARDHFWRLVWEQQVPAIVALTKCVEKGRDKCHQCVLPILFYRKSVVFPNHRYWPDNSQRSVLYADIEVTLLTESIEYEEFAIRELRLTNLADPSQPARSVQHLHYQAWPDFGVPGKSLCIENHWIPLLRTPSWHCPFRSPFPQQIAPITGK